MLTVLVKTIVNSSNSTLAKSITDTNTNTLYLFTFSNIHFFPWSSVNKVNKMIIVEKMENR